MVIMGWLVGVKGDANGDRPCKLEPTAPGGDVAVEAMAEKLKQKDVAPRDVVDQQSC